jgi:hypothetical protein
MHRPSNKHFKDDIPFIVRATVILRGIRQVNIHQEKWYHSNCQASQHKQGEEGHHLQEDRSLYALLYSTGHHLGVGQQEQVGECHSP